MHVPDPTRPEARVEVTVTNTGAREGAEVVQVYVSDPVSDVDRPVRELRGFRKVRLAPGESARVVIELDARAFSYWSTRHGRWVAEPGEYGVHVGLGLWLPTTSAAQAGPGLAGRGRPPSSPLT
ncbi:fibronectin type III-like domain-contianing protein [Nonomuraea sp. NPDC048901]|uniref:fibronectin type III-like domain-contianing protein n=1 Tax=Nonomuraea sp. NPDC048901 TaxID=3155627 RepID=UPI0033CE22FA